MALINKMCSNCDKSIVCEWAKTINKFDEEVTTRNPVKAEIEMKSCPEFREVEVKEEEE